MNVRITVSTRRKNMKNKKYLANAVFLSFSYYSFFLVARKQVSPSTQEKTVGDTFFLGVLRTLETATWT